MLTEINHAVYMKGTQVGHIFVSDLLDNISGKE